MDFKEIKNILKDKVKTAYMVVFAILIIFAYLIIIRVDLAKFSILKNEALEKEENLRILATIDNSKKTIEKFNNELSVDKDPYSLLGLITENAKKELITLDFVRPIESITLSGYRKISILVEGRASYHNIGRFILALETGDKYLIVEELQMRSHGGAQAFGAQMFNSAMRSPVPQEARPGPRTDINIFEPFNAPDTAGVIGEQAQTVSSLKDAEEEPVINFKLKITGFSVQK